MTGKSVVRFKHRFTVRLERKGDFRRGTESVFIKIPYVRVGVLHTVTQHQSYYVFALIQFVRYVVTVVIHYLVGI